MVSVRCPGCGRSIHLPPHELSIQIECASCGTNFAPTTPPPLPVPTGGPPQIATAPATPPPCPQHPSPEARPSSLPSQPQTTCPGCGSDLYVDVTFTSGNLQCPKCGTCFPFGATTPPRPGHPGARDPGHIAIAAFLAVIWLFVPTILAHRLTWNGSPATYEAYEFAVREHAKLDRKMEYLGLDPTLVRGGCFLFFLALAYFLVITSACVWERHNSLGRRLTIVSAVLLMPCTCCGLW
jgi:hypothetical protein